MKKLTIQHPAIGTLCLVPILGGCVPMITERWDVQPVEGRVISAQDGQPVAGASVMNADTPELTAITDQAGHFVIAGQSRTVFHMAMPASYLDHQQWVVTHPGHGDAVAITSTLAPPISEQPSELTVPMFPEPGSVTPDNCRFGGYRLQLADYYRNQPDSTEEHWRTISNLDFIECSDPELQTAWEQAMTESMR